MNSNLNRKLRKVLAAGASYGQYCVNVPVSHFVSGLAVNLSCNESRLSTSSYCYAGS